jgi:hypothetical protein
MTIGTRHDFGRDWNEVVNDWCLGQLLSIQDETAWEALGLLENLWPECLGEALARGVKGWPIMLEIVSTGLILMKCQSMRGFEGVLNRVRSGEDGALPELEFAATLVDLGYEPILDEPYGRTRPDALVISEGKEVCIDVISPFTSDEMKNAYKIMSTIGTNLRKKLTTQVTNLHIELYLLTPTPYDITEEVYSFLCSFPVPLPGVIHELPGLALIRYCHATNQLSPGISVDTISPILGSASADQTGNNVSVRFPIADERLELVMSRKRSQFSQNEINLLVINVTRIPGGFKGWQSLLQRRLQPGINKRFSGVALLQYHWNGTGVHRPECHLEQHPNPYKKLPVSLLNDLMRLNQSVS